MDTHFDKCIREAICEVIENIPCPDANNMWERIESSLEKLEERKKSPPYWKAAAVFLIVLMTGFVIFKPVVGETSPFGMFLRKLYDRAIGGTQRNVDFQSPGENPPLGKPVVLDPDEVKVVGATQEDFTETTLDELMTFYPKELYVPQEVLSSKLSGVLYQHVKEDIWQVMLIYQGGAIDFSLIQKTDVRESGHGIGYDEHSTKVEYIHENGIEYMFLLGRYNMSTVYWFQYGQMFTFSGNLTVEQAMSVIRSIRPYQ